MLYKRFNNQTVFDELFGTGFNKKTSVRELKDRFQIKVVAPGLKKKDFKIDFEDGLIKIEFKRDADREGLFTKEKFFKSWILPEGTEPEHISAKYDAGVLSISIDKTEAHKPKTQNIPIQ